MEIIPTTMKITGEPLPGRDREMPVWTATHVDRRVGYEYGTGPTRQRQSAKREESAYELEAREWYTDHPDELFLENIHSLVHLQGRSETRLYLRVDCGRSSYRPKRRARLTRDPRPSNNLVSPAERKGSQSKLPVAGLTTLTGQGSNGCASKERHSRWLTSNVDLGRPKPLHHQDTTDLTGRTVVVDPEPTQPMVQG